MQSRQYVSRFVPSDPRVLVPLLFGVAVVNSATLGYDSSMMNGLLILPAYSEYFHLTPAREGLNNAAMWIGGILGALLAQPLPDKFGRRRSIIYGCIITAIGIALQTAAQNIGMFVAGRLVIGIGSAVQNLSAPTLLGELLGPKGRARILGLFFSCYYVGSLLSAIVNYGSQNIMSTWAWRLPSLLQLIPTVIALALIVFVPESPRWLLTHGRDDEATEVIAIMQGSDNGNRIDTADNTAKEIKLVLTREAENYPRNPWRDIISGAANHRRLVILIAFGTMINMFGNFVISYYLVRILTQAGITETQTQTQIQVIINCWSFFVAIIGSFMLDVLGRRPQLLTCVAGMVISCLIGGLIKVYGSSSNTSGIYGTIAVIFFFQGFYAFAITPLTSLYATEVAPYKLRATAIAIFRAFDAAFGLLAAFVMPFAMQNLGWKFYFINAAWNLAFLILAYFTFVETKGLALEAIAAKFGDDVSCLEGVEVIEEQSEIAVKPKE